MNVAYHTLGTDVKMHDSHSAMEFTNMQECSFDLVKLYLWMPFNKCLCFLDIRAAPPQHA